MIILLIVAAFSALGYAAVKKQAEAISNPTAARVPTQVSFHNNLRTVRPDLFPNAQDVKSFGNVIEGAPTVFNPSDNRNNTAAPSAGGGGAPPAAGVPPSAPGGSPTGAGGAGLGTVGGRGGRFVF